MTTPDRGGAGASDQDPGTTPRRRPRWFTATFLGVQLLVPTVMLVVRLTSGGCRWGGWQMYACF